MNEASYFDIGGRALGRTDWQDEARLATDSRHLRISDRQREARPGALLHANDPAYICEAAKRGAQALARTPRATGRAGEGGEPSSAEE